MPIPKILVTLALTAAQMALTMTRTTEGPRLKDLQVSAADPGTPMPNGLGRVRVAAPVFYAEPLKEKKKKRKTKGGKHKEWLYFGTAAWVFAAHPTQRVRRIWFEKHLVYDATGESVQSIGQSSDTIEDLDGNNTNFNDLVSIYLGGEDQEPDPRMLAYIETREGVGTCPAYRGMSYLIAKDFPLDKLGNKMPSIVEVEYAGIGGEAYPMTRRTFDLGGGMSFLSSSASAEILVGYASAWDDLTVWDNQSRSMLNQVFDYKTQSFIFDTVSYSGIDILAVADDGTIFGEDESTTEIFCSMDTLGTETITGLHETGNLRSANVFVLPDATERVVLFNAISPPNDPIYVWVWNRNTETMLQLDIEAQTGVLWAPFAMWQDSFGDVWVAGAELVVDTTTLYFWRVIDNGGNPGVGDFHAVTGFHTISQMPMSMSGFEASDGDFLVMLSDETSLIRYLYKVDSTTFTIGISRDYGPGFNFFVFNDSISVGAESFWWGFDDVRAATEVDAETLADIRTVDMDLWYADEDGDPETIFSIDRLTGAFIGGANDFDPEGGSISWRDISEGLTLGTAIRYFSGLVALVEWTDYSIHADVDSIPITGYSWTQGTAKQSLELLLDLYDCECRVHDGLPHFIKRGGSVGASLTTPEFVIQAGQPETRFKLTIANDSDIPRRVVLTYAGTESDLQPVTAKAQRRLDSFDGVGELTIDGTTVTLEPDTAQQLTDRYFRRKHFSILTGEFRLSARHLAIEPGDIRPIDFDGTTITMHVDKVTDSADGSRHIVCTNDDPALAVVGAGVGAEQYGRPESEIFSPGASVGFVLDVPLLTDAHDQAAPLVYIAGGPEDPDASYVGTEFHQSDTGDDDTYLAGWDGTGLSDPATFGATTTELPEALPWVMDNGSTLTVVLANGTLSSVTEDQLLNSATLNLALVGDELVQFKTATLTAPLTYNLSGFFRGVRGTEQHIAAHTATDRFVLLDTVGLHNMGASELGDEDYYIAAAPGTTPNPANEFPIEFSGAAHRPYAPVHGTLTRDAGSGDWSINAVRRTRIGGAAVNGQDPPLGETSESWEADIYDGATFKRTIVGTALPLTYTNAMQVTDFGAPQTTGFEVNLYQMSPALSLRGFPLALAA